MSISGNCTSREFTVALQHLKQGKALGPDSIFPELILYAGAALKVQVIWLSFFLLSSTQNFQNLKKSAGSHDPKACGGP